MCLLLTAFSLAACRPGETWEAPENASLGDLVLVVHGNTAGRQLEVLLERLEPDGCQEGSPGCDWAQKAPLLLDLVESQVDETWSGTLEKVEVGNYRLEASASLEGSSFGTASKVPVEIRRSNQPQLHLLLRQQMDMPAHQVPYFDSLFLDVHPVEPNGSVQITIGAGPATANLQLWARSEDPVPQGSSTCPGGGCNRGVFTESFPLPFDTALGRTITWQAPPDPGSFHHPIELEIKDASNATAKIRFQVEVAALCEDCDLVVALTAEGRSTCALTKGGDVLCWGQNNAGQAGPGGSRNLQPQLIPGLSGATKIDLGNEHGCAVRSDGKVLCWGKNNNGQLGRGNQDNLKNDTAALVQNLDGATEISASKLIHTCAVRDQGEVWCWGYNGNGELGDGTTTLRTTPVRTGTISTGVRVTTSYSHSCAALANGQASCWGAQGSYTKLGRFGNDIAPAPPDVVSNLTGVADITSGDEFTCARYGGEIKCWGDNGQSQLGASNAWSPPWAPQLVPVNTITTATQMDSGYAHTCARLSNGNVVCWGMNWAGQLGAGKVALPKSFDPRQIAGVQNALQVVSGGGHSCALIDGGEVLCWGSNDSGQLGDGTWGNDRHTVAPVVF